MNASFFDQFNVVNIFGGVTNSSFIMLLLTSFTLIISYSIYVVAGGGLAVKAGHHMVPSRTQSIQEIVYTHFLGLIQDSTDGLGACYFTFIISLFVFVAGLNVLGLFPYVFTPTAHVLITCGLSFSIIMGVTTLGIIRFRGDYLSIMMPSGAPLYLAPLLVIIETVSYISRAISLGVRLAANLSAGHLLFAILASFSYMAIKGGMLVFSLVPLTVMILITLLEIAVGLIQAYVFCLLTSIYISGALSLH